MAENEGYSAPVLHGIFYPATKGDLTVQRRVCRTTEFYGFNTFCPKPPSGFTKNGLPFSGIHQKRPPTFTNSPKKRHFHVQKQVLSLPVVQYLYSICTVCVRFGSVHILYIYCTYTVQRAQQVVQKPKNERQPKRGLNRHRGVRRATAAGPPRAET